MSQKRDFHMIAAMASMVLLCTGAPSPARALTLQEGLAVVAEKGRDVVEAGASLEAARGAVSFARASYFPSIDLYGRETWLRYQPEAKFGTSTVATSQDQYASYGVKATQVVYDFGKTSSAVDAAGESLHAKEAVARRARNRSCLEFITAYYDLLEAEKLVQVASDEVKQYDTHRHDAQVRYEAGVVTRNEVLQAEVTLADSRQRALTAENVLTLRASRVNSMLLRPLTGEVRPEEVQASPASGITLEAAWAAAESGSPEVRELEALIRAKEGSIRSIRAEYLPSIYISGAYDYMENQYLVYPHNWTVIAGVTMNLFSGGSSTSKVQMGRSELTSLQVGRDKLIDAVRLEVQRAYLEVQLSRQKVDVVAAAVAQAEENLRIQRLRYQEGVGTAIELLDAVTLLTTTQSNVWKASYSVQRAEAALLYAMGQDLTAAYSAPAVAGQKDTRSAEHGGK